VALCQARTSTKPLWGLSSSNPYHPSHVPNNHNVPNNSVPNPRVSKYKVPNLGINLFHHEFFCLECWVVKVLSTLQDEVTGQGIRKFLIWNFLTRNFVI
jgi:hypothetical protein